MKKITFLPFFVFLAVAAILIWILVGSEPVSKNLSYANFTVSTGMSASGIGAELYKAGLIKDATLFKVYVQFSGVSNHIQAGDYRLSPSFNLFQIADVLSKAPVEVRVTIPEGLRREEIAEKFANSLDQNQAFVSEFLNLSQGEEGSLFPDTYLIANNATAGAILSKMRSNFDLKTSQLSISKNQLILASLIERETRNTSERPVVAGILLNRLNAGWPLQVDATIQYAVADVRCQMSDARCSWWPELRHSDLSTTSSYNTYENTGLPPTPICNPGLSSIEAAVNPVSTDYWYYLHDSTGQIHYAKTLDEQNANIQKYLQ